MKNFGRFGILGILGINALCFLAVSLIFTVSAQVNGVAGMVNNTEISDNEAKPGDILSNTDSGIIRSIKNYDAQMIGVVVEFPVISLGNKTDSSVPVLDSGRAIVNVTAGNGPIKAGDFITSSETAGVGQKATTAGYVIGKALAVYEDSSQNGQIAVLVDIGYYAPNPSTSGLLGSLLSLLTAGFQNSQNFPLVLRYVAAALIGIATFGFASVSFLRFMRNGIEAIGRNPLAKATIVSGMVLNGVVVGIMAIAGFGIAVAIVVL
jgi:hypothetical protein